MKIQINGENAMVSANNLAQLIEDLGYESETVATALNGEFVTCAQRDMVSLSENDKLEIVAPMQGG